MKATIRTSALTESAVTCSLIQRRTQMSLEEYRWLFVEIGCQFIERLFNVPGYEDMVEFYLQDSTSRYWKWWRAEWINNERKVYTQLQSHFSLSETDKELVKRLFTGMVTCDQVHKSFLNHCKYIMTS